MADALSLRQMPAYQLQTQRRSRERASVTHQLIGSLWLARGSSTKVFMSWPLALALSSKMCFTSSETEIVTSTRSSPSVLSSVIVP